MYNFSALSSSNFRIYILATFFSTNGFWIQKVLLAWLSWELTKSPTFLGFAIFFTFLPTIILGPLFGVFVDKANIKIAAFLTFFSMFFISIALLISSISNTLNPLTLIIFCLLIGVTSSANHPIRLSLGPRLVNRKNQFSSVVAFSSTNFNLSRLLGPVIGGFIINFYGINSCILISSFCYLPALIIIPLLTPRSIENLSIENSSIYKEFIEGMKYILKDKLIVLSLFISSITSFFGRSVLETLPIISEGIFQRGPSGLGLLTSSAGIGALIASFLKIMLLKQVSSKISEFTYVMLLFIPINLVLLGLTKSFNQCLFLIGLIAFCITLIQINMQSGLQIALSDDLRGRIMSIWIMITFGSAALGSVFLGLISELFSINSTFIIFGLLTILLIGFSLIFKMIFSN